MNQHQKRNRTSSRKNIQVATEQTPRPATEATHIKCKLKLQQKVINEFLADEKDINNEIFLNYFKYQNPSFLV